ncbi:hypothetical protein J1N35_011567 [Gossypium stocksii]|uniref:Putative plant transposon protein domain-containing protein n=1 Tax=Gossypium stocksii TaxID=47602 RepID=A0A9D3W292_9ROSI|nr:hypothetical protein J1N35_011567 [Gossypium stocksii]
MHLKKAFTLKESNYKDFMARIRQVAKALNWELFCKKRPSVDEDLVREFYANLTSSELTEVPVYEIKVPINSNAINEFFELPDFENHEYSSLLSNIKPKNLQEILKELTVLGSKWTMSNQRIHTCQREYLTPLAKKTGYSQGTITDWDLYRVPRDSVLQQRVEESEDPKEAEHHPTKIEPEQSAEVPNEAKPMEPEAEPDTETLMFRTQPPSPDLRDELSKLMDIMQHMQWQQQAYLRYLKIRDDSMKSALKKIYNDPFIFVSEFLDFIFEPWSPLSKKEQSDSCKGNNDEAKDESNSEGSANK